MTGRSSSVRLLVSVRNPDEAEAAVLGGADVIDIKEPDRGPLGPADGHAVGQIVRRVASRRPVSVALGELCDGPMSDVTSGVALAKIGLAGASANWHDSLVEAFAQAGVPGQVAVAYADADRVEAPGVEEVLDWAVTHEATGVLIDTAVKDGQGLFEHLELTRVERIICDAHRAGLLVALAGSLNHDTLQQAADLDPNLVAVRSAACRGGDRSGPVEASRVRGLVNLLAGYTPAADSIGG